MLYFVVGRMRIRGIFLCLAITLLSRASGLLLCKTPCIPLGTPILERSRMFAVGLNGICAVSADDGASPAPEEMIRRIVDAVGFVEFLPETFRTGYASLARYAYREMSLRTHPNASRLSFCDPTRDWNVPANYGTSTSVLGCNYDFGVPERGPYSEDWSTYADFRAWWREASGDANVELARAIARSDAVILSEETYAIRNCQPIAWEFDVIAHSPDEPCWTECFPIDAPTSVRWPGIPLVGGVCASATRLADEARSIARRIETVMRYPEALRRAGAERTVIEAAARVNYQRVVLTFRWPWFRFEACVPGDILGERMRGPLRTAPDADWMARDLRTLSTARISGLAEAEFNASEAALALRWTPPEPFGTRLLPTISPPPAVPGTCASACIPHNLPALSSISESLDGVCSTYNDPDGEEALERARMLLSAGMDLVLPPELLARLGAHARRWLELDAAARVSARMRGDEGVGLCDPSRALPQAVRRARICESDVAERRTGDDEARLRLIGNALPLEMRRTFFERRALEAFPFREGPTENTARCIPATFPNVTLIDLDVARFLDATRHERFAEYGTVGPEIELPIHGNASSLILSTAVWMEGDGTGEVTLLLGEDRCDATSETPFKERPNLCQPTDLLQGDALRTMDAVAIRVTYVGPSQPARATAFHRALRIFEHEFDSRLILRLGVALRGSERVVLTVGDRMVESSMPTVPTARRASISLEPNASAIRVGGLSTRVQPTSVPCIGPLEPSPSTSGVPDACGVCDGRNASCTRLPDACGLPDGPGTNWDGTCVFRDFPGYTVYDTIVVQDVGTHVRRAANGVLRKIGLYPRERYGYAPAEARGVPISIDEDALVPLAMAALKEVFGERHVLLFNSSFAVQYFYTPPRAGEPLTPSAAASALDTPAIVAIASASFAVIFALSYGFVRVLRARLRPETPPKRGRRDATRLRRFV